jgi:hypothetical protein
MTLKVSLHHAIEISEQCLVVYARRIEEIVAAKIEKLSKLKGACSYRRLYVFDGPCS